MRTYKYIKNVISYNTRFKNASRPAVWTSETLSANGDPRAVNFSSFLLVSQSPLLPTLRDACPGNSSEA